MSCSNTLTAMDVWMPTRLSRISGSMTWHNGYGSSGARVWNLILARTGGVLQGTARNDCPIQGISWLVRLKRGGHFPCLPFFSNFIVLSLWYAIRYYIWIYSRTNYYRLHPLGIAGSIRQPKGFFMTFLQWPVLWLCRLTNKGPNFNPRTVIGSGKAVPAQNVAGVWGVCGIAVASKHETL